MKSFDVFVIKGFTVNQCRTHTGCPKNKKQLEDNSSKGIKPGGGMKFVSLLPPSMSGI